MYNDHERHRADLRQYAEMGLKITVIIHSGNKRCKEGQLLNGKEFPLQVMLEQSLLPYDGCKFELGCNCSYGARVERDKDGRIIRQEYLG